MQVILRFMEGSPFLTFFILVVLTETIIRLLRPGKKNCPHCGKPYNLDEDEG